MTTFVLTDEDRFYLVENLWMEEEGGPGDQQAQQVYCVQSNVIDLSAPLWSREETERQVQAVSHEFEVPMRVSWVRGKVGASATDEGGGWLLEFPAERGHPYYRPLRDGEYLASTALHEIAHAITPTVAANVALYNTPDFQSHGPEFVGCYLDLLARVMDTTQALAAFEFLSVDVGGAR